MTPNRTRRLFKVKQSWTNEDNPETLLLCPNRSGRKCRPSNAFLSPIRLSPLSDPTMVDGLRALVLRDGDALLETVCLVKCLPGAVFTIPLKHMR